LHFKANFKSLRQCSHYILNHSKWSTYHEDVNKCSVIGRQLMMGWSTLASVKNRKFVPMKFPTFELTPQINTWISLKMCWPHLNQYNVLDQIKTTVTTDAERLFLKISETTIKTKSFNCNVHMLISCGEPM
jgi:hypothetical protein